MENKDIIYPAMPEQRQIGTFFASLDDLIALHQRKLENTHNVLLINPAAMIYVTH
jgi:restriction endonuclease S subunit